MSSESPKPTSILDETKRSYPDIDNSESKDEENQTQEEQYVILSSKEPVQGGYAKITAASTEQNAQPKNNIIRAFWHMPPERKSVAVSIIALLIAIIATIFTYGQYRAARDSVIIAQKGLDIANEQLRDARAGAAAAEDRANRMTKANEDLAAAARLQAEGIKESVVVGKGSARAAEKSANIAQQTLIVSNRAFVCIDKMRFFKPLEADKPIDLIFEFANDGNNPAELGGFSVAYISPSLRKCEYGARPNISKIIIAPKSPRTQRLNIAPNGISQQWIDAIKDCSSDGLCKRYIQVCIKTSYTTLGGEYKFEDCSYYSPGLNAFVACKR